MADTASPQGAGHFAKAKQLGGQTLVYGFGDALYKAVAFVLLPIYLKYLTPAQYGAIDMLLVTQGLTVTLIAMGMPGALVRFFCRETDEARKLGAICAIFFLSLVTQISVPLMIFFGSEHVADLVLGSPEYGFLVAILAVNIFLVSFRAIPLALYRAQNRPWIFVGIGFSVAFTTLVMNVYFVAFGGKGVLGVILGNLCGGLVGIALVLPKIFREVSFKIERGIIGSILRYAVPIGLSQIPLTVIFLADRYFILRLAGLHEVGIYALAYKLGSIINVFFVMPFTLAWGPFLFENAKEAHAKELYGRMSSYYVIAGISLVVILSVFSTDIIRIIARQPGYADAAHLVPVLSYAFFMFGLSNVMCAGIMISGRTYISMTVIIICMVLNLALNYTLIGAYGYSGAAYSLLLTFAASTTAVFFFSRSLYRIRYEFGRITRVIAVSLVIVVFAHLSLQGSDASNVLLRFAFVAAFFVFIYYGGGITPAERRRLWRQISGFLSAKAAK